MFPTIFYNKRITNMRKIISVFAVLTLSACSEHNPKINQELSQEPSHEHKQEKSSKSTATTSKQAQQTKSNLPVLNVYKSPTCSCCEKWLDHIDEQGFQSIAHKNTTLTSFKQSLGIAPQYRSCHTAVSKQGYIFEGHVPAKFIHQFLTEQQTALTTDALGLAVPAMPVGSPGMEMGEKFIPYKILLLKNDGSSDVYATIHSYKEQF